MENETKQLMQFAELLADTARSICLDALQEKQTVVTKTRSQHGNRNGFSD